MIREPIDIIREVTCMHNKISRKRIKLNKGYRVPVEKILSNERVNNCHMVPTHKKNRTLYKDLQCLLEENGYDFASIIFKLKPNKYFVWSDKKELIVDIESKNIVEIPF